MTCEEFVENRLTQWRIVLTDEAHPEPDVTAVTAALTKDFQRGAIDFGDLGQNLQNLATGRWLATNVASHCERLATLGQKGVLVMSGKYDKLIPPAAGAELAKAISGARFLEYSGGHNFPPDQLSLMIEAIQDLVN